MPFLSRLEIEGMRWIGTFLVVIGLILATNFIVAGPEAFALHWYAVLCGSVAGILLVSCGIRLIK